MLQTPLQDYILLAYTIKYLNWQSKNYLNIYYFY